MKNALLIAPGDDVAVALTDLAKGEAVLGVTALEDVPAGHKIALTAIAKGSDVHKYGHTIGHAAMDIAPGQHVHTHNLRTNLSGELDYSYQPAPPGASRALEGSFMGYERPDGRVGTRNEIWIIPTVGCVAQTAEQVAHAASNLNADGVYALTHPYGCSQLADDHARTRDLLALLARHPNCAGALILGLGCENNHVHGFQEALGDYDPARIKFLNAQDEEDELSAALELVRELIETASGDRRTAQPLSKLVVGLKCGGSDGFSGLTANPLLGAFSDGLVGAGGTALMTEVPEMFGAEVGLLNRSSSRPVFDEAVRMINGYKRYFLRFGQPFYVYPSPGNNAGGITTLEDKSLGCTQKGGSGPVVGVLDYARPVRARGLNLVNGPGNDGCAITALAAAGAQVILFTTGRGTPMGAPVPTLKIASNTPLAKRKHNWIDFDAGPIARDESLEAALERFSRLVIGTASGAKAKNELNGQRAITLFKDGVTL